MTSAPKQVVIVEDDPDLLAMLVRQFREQQFGVFTAHDGVEGLARILQVRPDLIVLDLLMPRLHGQEMLERLYRQQAWTRRVPVLVLTNYDYREQLLSLVGPGTPVAYMVKSNHSLAEIVERAKQLVKTL